MFHPHVSKETLLPRPLDPPLPPPPLPPSTPALMAPWWIHQLAPAPGSEKWSRAGGAESSTTSPELPVRRATVRGSRGAAKVEGGGAVGIIDDPLLSVLLPRILNQLLLCVSLRPQPGGWRAASSERRAARKQEGGSFSCVKSEHVNTKRELPVSPETF